MLPPDLTVIQVDQKQVITVESMLAAQISPKAVTRHIRAKYL